MHIFGCLIKVNTSHILFKSDAKRARKPRKTHRKDNYINFFEKIGLGITPHFKKTEKSKKIFLYLNLPKSLSLSERVKKSSLWHS